MKSTYRENTTEFVLTKPKCFHVKSQTKKKEKKKENSIVKFYMMVGITRLKNKGSDHNQTRKEIRIKKEGKKMMQSLEHMYSLLSKQVSISVELFKLFWISEWKGQEQRHSEIPFVSGWQ